MKSSFVGKLHQQSQAGFSSKSTLGSSTSKKNNQLHESSQNSHVKMMDENNEANLTKVGSLLKHIGELETREQRYIDKLNKLQRGLEQQYIESMKLQQLYSELLDSYKAKEEQIKELEIRYKVFEQSERKRVDEYGSDLLKKDNSMLQQLLEKHKSKITQLEQDYEEATKSLVVYKSLAMKIDENKTSGSSVNRLMEQINQMQKENDNLRHNNATLQCQNEYLSKRYRDIDSQRQQMDRLIVGKQQQIARLRDQKLNLLKNDDRKLTSPRLSPRDMSPSRQNQKFRSLQAENKQLRVQLQDARSQITQLNSVVAIQREKLFEVQEHCAVSAKPDDFFSFSKEQLYDGKRHMPTLNVQKASYNWLRQEDYYTDIDGSDIPVLSSNQTRKIQREDEQLPPFPKELQIDSLIKTLEKTQQKQDSKWEVVRE